MENSIQKFNFKGNEIRTICKDGEPWWVAKDVCDILELSNPTAAIAELEEDERAKYSLGRQGEANIINEPGLYSLVLRSRKPEAKAFKRWITHEVIPSIRKTGGYASPALDKKLEIMDKNADARLAHATAQKAKVMLDMMKSFKDSMTQTSRQVFMAKCGELLSGQDLSELLPKATRKLYSAAQVGEMFGLSAKAIGHIANENSLKAPEGQINKFGEWKCSKSRYSSKEVPMWFYSDEAVEWFRRYCESASHE